MRIAILSNGNGNYSTKRWVSEAEARGHEVRVIKYKDCYIELNEKHIDALEYSAEIALSSGAMFILGSDAHTTDKVGLFPRVEEFVKRHSVPEERICGAGAKPVFSDKRGGER